MLKLFMFSIALYATPVFAQPGYSNVSPQVASQIKGSFALKAQKANGVAAFQLRISPRKGDARYGNLIIRSKADNDLCYGPYYLEYDEGAYGPNKGTVIVMTKGVQCRRSGKRLSNVWFSMPVAQYRVKKQWVRAGFGFGLGSYLFRVQAYQY